MSFVAIFLQCKTISKFNGDYMIYINIVFLFYSFRFFFSYVSLQYMIFFYKMRIQSVFVDDQISWSAAYAPHKNHKWRRGLLMVRANTNFTKNKLTLKNFQLHYLFIDTCLHTDTFKKAAIQNQTFQQYCVCCYKMASMQTPSYKSTTIHNNFFKLRPSTCS
jgi:hypothetical protein